MREADLVQSIANTFWRMKRIPCLESAFFAKGYLEFADAFDEHDPSVSPGLIQAEAFLKYEKQLRSLQLQEARLFRRYEKDRAELLSLQQARQQREMKALQIAAARFEAARQVLLAHNRPLIYIAQRNCLCRPQSIPSLKPSRGSIHTFSLILDSTPTRFLPAASEAELIADGAIWDDTAAAGIGGKLWNKSPATFLGGFV